MTHADQIEAVLAEHHLHASMNTCVGSPCRWRPTPDGGSLVVQHRAHVAAVLAALTPEPVAGGLSEAVGLLNDLVTAKKLRLDTEEWQLVWDRVFRFLAARAVPVLAETDGEVEALARIRGFAESRAITARALGREDRDWLDLLILLDKADAASRRPAETDGLAEKVRALADEMRAESERAAVRELSDPNAYLRRTIYDRFVRKLDALIDTPTQGDKR